MSAAARGGWLRLAVTRLVIGGVANSLVGWVATATGGVGYTVGRGQTVLPGRRRAGTLAVRFPRPRRSE